MKMTAKKLLALLLALVMTFALAACGKKDASTDAEKVTLPVADGATIGTGATAITVEVQSGDGKSISFTVNTDEETVGAALLKLGVVSGEDSQYGLYVKSVNGETADYDVDGTYWAFYVNGEYAMASVDAYTPEAGTTYGFRVEKGA